MYSPHWKFLLWVWNKSSAFSVASSFYFSSAVVIRTLLGFCANVKMNDEETFKSVANNY